MRPRLLFIAGPNGSGKTSITRRIVAHEWARNILYINPDDIAENRYGGWNNKDAILRAAQEAERLRQSALNNTQDLLFETVFSAPDKFQFIVDSKQSGYFIRGFFISTSDPAINAARVTRRVMEGGHSVPIEKIISRYTKSIAHFAAALPYLDRGYVFDNSIDDTDAKLLFRTENGKIKRQYEQNVPDWALPIAIATHQPTAPLAEEPVDDNVQTNSDWAEETGS